jgi:hypothetical protein
MTGDDVARSIAVLNATPPDVITEAKKILGD